MSSLHSAIYSGIVRHRRASPVKNEFSYSVCLFYLDLAEIDEIFNVPFLFSSRSPSLFGFSRKNYLGNPEQSLDEAVRTKIYQEKGRRPAGPIRILTQISYLGFCFNPVSFYYCFDSEDKKVDYILAEITNTPWGEKFSYILECSGEERIEQFDFDKTFHVSPFMAMEMTYRWLFSTPLEHLSVHTENRDQAGSEKEPSPVIFDATVTLKRTRWSNLAVVKVLFTHPLLTFKTVFLIYYQALKLWLKKTPIYTHPGNSGVVIKRRAS